MYNFVSNDKAPKLPSLNSYSDVVSISMKNRAFSLLMDELKLMDDHSTFVVLCSSILVETYDSESENFICLIVSHTVHRNRLYTNL